MPSRRHHFAREAVALAAAIVAVGVAAGRLFPTARAANGDAAIAAQQRILQALNRLTWGAAPGDVEKVERMGLEKWIQRQLHPDEIPENPELERALAPYETLRMSAPEILANDPPPEVIRQMALGKAPLPSDAATRAMVEREIARYEARLQAKQEDGAAAETGAGTGAREERPSLADFVSPEQARALQRGTPEARVAALAALPAETRDQVIAALPRGQALQLAAWAPADLERSILSQVAPQMIVPLDLEAGKILRATETQRQLQDVLTDFWFNHFNIYINKGADRFLITSYERDAIRPRVFGKFYDLLLATAQSPAMLFYLDNWQSVDPNAQARQAAARRAREMARMTRFGIFAPPPGMGERPPKPNTPPARGLNENYGREVMELHTVGLHYTQADVIAAARCFTGWTIGEPRRGGPFRDPVFYFNPALHDRGEKTVLGHRIGPDGPGQDGLEDGYKVLRILAESPDTAEHISHELAQRFVADDPPADLVRRMSATYLASDGDLRQVMEAMIASPEFWEAQYYRDKVKSPLELVVSALRATNAQISNPARLTRIIAGMGQPLYGKEPPTGYANTGDQWVSASGLLARMNFAQELAANRIPGVRVDLSPFAPGQADGAEVTQALYGGLLDNQISDNTRAAIWRELKKVDPGAEATGMENPRPLGPAQVALLAGLTLGSPEFQKH